MVSLALKKALNRDLPVLFVNIGWGIQYDGTETIVGNHKYIKENPGARVGESRAFIARNRVRFQCGIGYGQAGASGPLHIVFLARDPGDHILKCVGVYAAAEVLLDGNHWAVARTRFAERIPVERRQAVIGWPAGQGMRRWAKRNDKPNKEHKVLASLFRSVAKHLSHGHGLPKTTIGAAEDEEGHEGEIKKLLIRHRKREHRLRRKKTPQEAPQRGSAQGSIDPVICSRDSVRELPSDDSSQRPMQTVGRSDTQMKALG
jgi:hypothetical protein